MDIVDTASSADNFKTLVKAVVAAGLVETLRGPGPFTVFAPTDEAFERLPWGALDGLLNDIPKLTQVLTYHVASGKLTASDVMGLVSTPTVQGQTLKLSFDGTTVKVGDASVVQADIDCDNGVIHAIDAVLMPTFEDAPAHADAAEATESDAGQSGGSMDD